MNIKDAKELLELNDYKIFKSMGASVPGYKAYVNEWNIFQPWMSDSLIEKVVSKLQTNELMTLVNRDRLYVLKTMLLNCISLQGEIWEAGVYQGGSALLACDVLRSVGQSKTNVRLFDTFSGMPKTHAEFDCHNEGDFSDTSLEAVMKLVGSDSYINYYKGLVPNTYRGLENSKIKFAHIDLDIYEPIKASCEFIWPRLQLGGIMVFDDYGFVTCPGAKKAVDEFFADFNIYPLVLPTGSAIVFKNY